jgi:hypothetical protein
VISLLVAAATFTFFYSTKFRAVIGSDTVRICVILLFCFMPNADPLMRLSYLSFYGLWFVVLVTLMDLPEGFWQRTALLAVLLLAIWSNPLVVVCLPVIAVRFLQSTNRIEKMWWAGVAVLILGYAFTADRAPVLNIFNHPSSVQSVVHAVAYRVFCYFFLGSALAQPLPSVGWGLLLRFSLLLIAATALVAVIVAREIMGKERQRAWISLAVFYLIVALPSLFVLRREWIQDFLGPMGERTWLWHQRYFFCSMLLLCVLGGMAYERIVRNWLCMSVVRQIMGGGLLLWWISLHMPTFRLWDWHVEPGWKTTARKIWAAEVRVNETGAPESVHIPNAVDSFVFDLLVTPKKGKQR